MKHSNNIFEKEKETNIMNQKTQELKAMNEQLFNKLMKEHEELQEMINVIRLVQGAEADVRVDITVGKVIEEGFQVFMKSQTKNPKVFLNSCYFRPMLNIKENHNTLISLYFDMIRNVKVETFEDDTSVFNSYEIIFNYVPFDVDYKIRFVIDK